MARPIQTAETEIAAPISVCWRVMTDFARYGEWNPFLPAADLLDGPEVRVGSRVRLRVRWTTGGGVSSIERITCLQPPHGEPQVAELTYEYCELAATLHIATGRRVQLLRALGPSRTHYFTQTNPGGLILPLLPNQKVQAGLNAQTRAFRERCESMAP